MSDSTADDDVRRMIASRDAVIEQLLATIKLLQSKVTHSRDNEPVGAGDRLHFPWNGKVLSGKAKLIVETGAIGVEASICYVSKEKAEMML